MLNQELISKEFGFLGDDIFLNVSQVCMPPKRVQEAYGGFMAGYVKKFGEGVVDEAWGIVADCREKVAALVNAEHSHEIAFVKNTAEGMSILASCYPLKAGDSVVIADQEHQSTLFPWINAHERRGVKLYVVKSVNGAIPMQAMIDAIDETGARLRAGASARPKKLVSMQEELDALRARKDAAVEAGDFDGAAKVRDELREASAAFRQALEDWRRDHAEETIDATENDVAETVSSMSGVPVEKISATTAERLVGMEKTLGEAVVGQSEAIGAIARALRRSRALLADPKRPIGSFLFLGPTGVGKTHLAKMLADRVYGDDKALVAIDMSEYQEKYSSSRLVGAPPGYVGYDEGGQLTEKVRRRPYSVVLFDEFEKANSDVCNMLLQILDEGRLTDGQGRIVDFRNTIVICTANLGFDFAREGRSLGFSTETASSSHEVLKRKLMDEAKRAFRPELLNRFDETVVFRRLDRDDVKAILRLELAKLQERLKGLHIQLSLDRKAEDFLVEKGYDSALGARPLRRVVQEFVEDPLADLVLAGKTRPRMRGRLAKDGKSVKF